MMGTCVYLLRSKANPRKRYVGLTRDVEQRIVEHNRGSTAATAAHRPWQLVAATYFADRDKAESFERYLKHGSGHSFARRHFW